MIPTDSVVRPDDVQTGSRVAARPHFELRWSRPSPFAAAQPVEQPTVRVSSSGGEGRFSPSRGGLAELLLVR